MPIRLLAATCALLLTAGVAIAAKTPAKPAAAPAAKAEASKPGAMPDSVMQMMAAMAAPGPAHEKLKAFAGKWHAVVKTWMGPGDPVVNEGDSEAEMVLGGRVLEQEFKGTFMNKPFEGRGMTGYDNATHQYWATWVDNSSTNVTMSQGSMDDAGKMLTCTFTMPGMDGKPATMTTVTKMVDDKHMTYTMTGMMGGNQVPMMEITYTRK
jgi:hypothetical protein